MELDKTQGALYLFNSCSILITNQDGKISDILIYKLLEDHKVWQG